MEGTDIKLIIKQWDEKLKNHEEVDVEEIKKLEEEVATSNLNNTTKNDLANKLIALRIKALNIIKLKTSTDTDRITYWQVFYDDMMKIEGIDKIHDLITIIDKHKDNLIKREEIQEIEQLYSDCLPIAHKKLNQIELNRLIKEVNKKIKLFNNRVNRILEDDFGSWIKQLRLEKGYSLKELEKRSGVTSGYIHRLENGSRKTPSVPVAESLALGLGVNPREFLTKLNLSSTNNNDVNLSVTELLALSHFTINGNQVDRNQKAKLIDLLNLIFSSKPSTSFNDGVNIMNKVNELQNSLLQNE